jgi:hypothetical protein
LQFICLPLTFPFSGIRVKSGLSRNGAGMRIALKQVRYGFPRETARSSTFLKFVISGMGFISDSLHPAARSVGEGGPLPPSHPRVHARRRRGHSIPPEFLPPLPGTGSHIPSSRSSSKETKDLAEPASGVDPFRSALKILRCGPFRGPIWRLPDRRHPGNEKGVGRWRPTP